jgi:hypothetical protein
MLAGLRPDGAARPAATDRSAYGHGAEGRAVNRGTHHLFCLKEGKT